MSAKFGEYQLKILDSVVLTDARVWTNCFLGSEGLKTPMEIP